MKQSKEEIEKLNKPFHITSVCRQDILMNDLATKQWKNKKKKVLSITDEEMKHIADELADGLGQFTGTEQYYKYLTGLKLTDGVKWLADSAGCYWLLDIVASYQNDLKDVPFQLWGIEVKNREAVVTCREDSDKEAIVTQKIEYTDFPLNEFEFYCIDGVVLLKSEY